MSSADYSALPEDMKAARRWLVWRTGGKKPRKVPYYVSGKPRKGTLDSPEDIAQLGTLDDALAALQTGRYTGLGFALGADGNGGYWQGVDLDHLPEHPELQAIVDSLPGYTERSPSGTGLHAIGYGRKFDALGSNATGIEAYSHGRYFTVTGDSVGGGDVCDLADFVEGVLRPLHDTKPHNPNSGDVRKPDIGTTTPRATHTEPEHVRLRDDLESALRVINSDDYTTWVNVGQRLKKLGDMGRALWLNWSATSKKYKPHEAESKWEGFDGGSTGYQAIFANAQALGWKNPRAKVATANHPAWDYGSFPDDDGIDFSQPPGPVPDETPQEWPEPVIPGVLRTPEIPCDILPAGPWRDMVQAVATNTQTPPAMSVLTALAVLSTLLQGRYEVDLQTHREVLAFWSLTVSASGTRKTGVLGAFTAPLLYWEKLLKDRMRRDIARTEAIRSTTQKRIEGLKQSASKAKAEELQAIRDEMEREELGMPDELRAPELFCEDSTPETLQRLVSENGGRMGVISDEPGLFRTLGGLYSKGVASLDVFLKGHVGSALKVARAGRSVFVPRPCISLCLAIQPDIVADLAGSNQFRASGLMARFCYVIPVSNVGRRDVRARHPIPSTVRDGYKAAVLALLEGYPPPVGADNEPRPLPLTNEAEELYLDFAQEIEDNQGDGGEYGPITDWTSKLPGATARIAALIEIAAGGLNVAMIGQESMRAAIRLARLLITHTQAAFGLLGASAEESDANVILKWVIGRQRGEFTQREVHHALQYRFKDVKVLRKALESLAERGCIRFAERKKANGRPSVVIEANPAVLSVLSPFY